MTWLVFGIGLDCGLVPNRDRNVLQASMASLCRYTPRREGRTGGRKGSRSLQERVGEMDCDGMIHGTFGATYVRRLLPMICICSLLHLSPTRCLKPALIVEKPNTGTPKPILHNMEACAIRRQFLLCCSSILGGGGALSYTGILSESEPS